MTITERLAEHVGTLRFEDIPEPVVEKAKANLAHHIGVALLAAGSERGGRAVELAMELSGAGGACSIIGDRRRADPLEAVFANAMLMGHNGLDDFQLPPGVHSGIVVWPVALTVGETRRVSGRELLAAAVAGYDVMTVLCLPVWTWTSDPPRRPNAVFAPFGAAAVAARLLGLSRERTVHALGHAGHAGMGLTEGTEEIWTHHPLVARNGLMAAMLARSGSAATPTVVEGPNGVYRAFFRRDVPDSLTDGLATLGTEFHIANAELKQLSASALNMIPIELTQALVVEHGLAPDQIGAVDLVVPVEREHREAVWEGALAQGGTSRASSLRFRVASVIASKGADLDPYRWPDEAEFVALLGRIRLRFERDRPIRYARVEMVTTGGERYAVDADRHLPPRVDPLEWLTRCGHGVLPDDRLARLAELVGVLEEVEDVSALTALFAPDPPA
jgi:2-methylcitrate dehydratase PrpD